MSNKEEVKEEVKEETALSVSEHNAKIEADIAEHEKAIAGLRKQFKAEAEVKPMPLHKMLEISRKQFNQAKTKAK